MSVRVHLRPYVRDERSHEAENACGVFGGRGTPRVDEVTCAACRAHVVEQVERGEELPPGPPPLWVEYRAWTSALDQRDASRLRAERAEHELALLRASLADVDYEHLVDMEQVALPLIRHVVREELAAAVLVPAPWASWQKLLAIAAGICLWSGGFLAGAFKALP